MLEIADLPIPQLYVLSSVVIWGVIELCLVDNNSPVWYPYCGSWLLSLIAELCLLALPSDDPGQDSGFHKAKVFVEIIRVSFLFALPVSYWGFQRCDNQRNFCGDEESAGLLAENNAVNAPANGTSYGATSGGSNNTPENMANAEANTRMMKKIEESGNWWVYAKSFSVSCLSYNPYTGVGADLCIKDTLEISLAKRG